jgi:hypothetical protein
MILNNGWMENTQAMSETPCAVCQLLDFKHSRTCQSHYVCHGRCGQIDLAQQSWDYFERNPYFKDNKLLA